jgi:hypothetical protein
MSQSFVEGKIRFDFPDDWKVCRPEKSSFYNRHFQNFCGGCKEVDFLLLEPGPQTLWLLEVKDYTSSARKKSLELLDEIALKARDVLALLLAAAANDPRPNRGVGAFIAESGLPAKIRVVLHLEQPSKPSKLFPGAKIPVDFTQKLRQKVRCIDPHPIVVSTDLPHALWGSTWIP